METTVGVMGLVVLYIEYFYIISQVAQRIGHHLLSEIISSSFLYNPKRKSILI